MRSFCIVFASILVVTAQVTASETVTPEPSESAYHYVSHYAVEIDAPADVVWRQLIDLGSWMYDFELSLESGTSGQEGEVRRLYSGQDFLIQVTKVIPNELLVFANLPLTFNGEHSTGIAVITLHEVDSGTTVMLTMNRRYSWESAEPNAQRSMRESPEFQEQASAMWNDRFLPRLKSLAEYGNNP